MAGPGRADPPGRSRRGAGLGCGRGCWAWSHLPGAGHPPGPPAAPRRTAPVGRLGRRDHRDPAGGSDRGQHDLSPAPPRPRGWVVTFGAAGGVLAYWVLPAERLVVLL